MAYNQILGYDIHCDETGECPYKRVPKMDIHYINEEALKERECKKNNNQVNQMYF